MAASQQAKSNEDSQAQVKVNPSSSSSTADPKGTGEQSAHSESEEKSSFNREDISQGSGVEFRSGERERPYAHVWQFAGEHG